MLLLESNKLFERHSDNCCCKYSIKKIIPTECSYVFYLSFSSRTAAVGSIFVLLQV